MASHCSTRVQFTSVLGEWSASPAWRYAPAVQLHSNRSMLIDKGALAGCGSMHGAAATSVRLAGLHGLRTSVGSSPCPCDDCVT